ncbi:unnamed protein product [Rotaria magnacalcarata]
MATSAFNLAPSDNMMITNQSNTSLAHDFHCIELCFEHNPVSVSASEMGFAHAFVRLGLEHHLLSRHLSELFSHSDLLQTLYKREAFLRTDGEDLRKQFLAHIESLGLLDYKCFSNSYPDIDIIYHVIIVPTRARATGISSITTANPYIALAGHDNTGLILRWNIDHVLVRHQLTNNVYRFPCGRWLGKGVDDDSLERLLVIDSTYSCEMNDSLDFFQRIRDSILYEFRMKHVSIQSETETEKQQYSTCPKGRTFKVEKSFFQIVFIGC